MKKMSLYVDGGSRGNPGPGGIGVVIFDDKKQRVKEFYKYLGVVTNNIAEYQAVIYGLQEALILRADEVQLNLDSELIANQLKGDYKVKDANIKLLFEIVLHLVKGFKKVDIVHITREKNKEADKLVNKAINLSALV